MINHESGESHERCQQKLSFEAQWATIELQNRAIISLLGEYFLYCGNRFCTAGIISVLGEEFLYCGKNFCTGGSHFGSRSCSRVTCQVRSDLPLAFAMAKSKNHTNHNQIYKNNRNGIKKTRSPKKISMKGMNCKFVRNQAFAKRGMMLWVCFACSLRKLMGPSNSKNWCITPAPGCIFSIS